MRLVALRLTIRVEDGAEFSSDLLFPSVGSAPLLGYTVWAHVPMGRTASDTVAPSSASLLGDVFKCFIFLLLQ